MYLNCLGSTKTGITRKHFVCVALPLLIALRVVAEAIICFLTDHALEAALHDQNRIAISGWVISKYVFGTLFVLSLFGGYLYATACVTMGRLRHQRWPVWLSFLMIAADVFVLPFIWIPICLLKGKRE